MHVVRLSPDASRDKRLHCVFVPGEVHAEGYVRMMDQRTAAEFAYRAALAAQSMADHVRLSFNDQCQLAGAWAAVASQFQFVERGAELLAEPDADLKILSTMRRTDGPASATEDVGWCQCGRPGYAAEHARVTGDDHREPCS